MQGEHSPHLSHQGGLGGQYPVRDWNSSGWRVASLSSQSTSAYCSSDVYPMFMRYTGSSHRGSLSSASGGGDQFVSSSFFLVTNTRSRISGERAFSTSMGYQSLGIGIGSSGTLAALIETVFSLSSSEL